MTKYTYNALDFVTQINYNGGKQASYRYNKVGELVEMEDWTGTTSFEVDLLRRITQVTDRKGNVVEYTYDEVGNQTSIDYPDGTGVDYAYDLLHQLKTVTEEDGRTTAYTYDGMGRVVKMEYPHGWVEDYVYDSIGQLLRVNDTDPTQKDMKQQKHVYKYDDCGNMIYKYMRGNGTGEATTENTYTYDALHRITRVDEVYGKAWREYQYDSLGNLTYERNSNNVHYDYKLNNLNQITQKTYSSNDKEGTLYTYDNRGNLVLEQYGKLNGNGNGNGNGQRSTVGQYTYDETNKMVLGVNSSGESSAYLYNGLGALVEDTWKIAKNGYGYHDVDAGLDDADTSNGRGGGGSNGNGNGNGNGQGNGNGSGDKPTGSLVTNFSTVVKQFVVDYTSPTFEPLMEHEVNGLDYRYVYGNDRLSVNITGVETSSGNLIENGNQIRLYYHMDYLGTTDYLTSPVSLKVTSWTHYNEWGEITHNAVLKSGKRELDLVKRYATHDYDAVLGMYYAKARFYDAENRRFAAMDPVKGEITNPMTMVQYIYVIDCPLVYVDVAGERVSLNPHLDGGGGSVTPKPTTGTSPIPKPASSNSAQFSDQLTVTANQVRARTGPGLNYSIMYVLNKGDKVIDLKQNDKRDGYTWRKVQANGKICWVADHYLKSGTGTPITNLGSIDPPPEPGPPKDITIPENKPNIPNNKPKSYGNVWMFMNLSKLNPLSEDFEPGAVLAYLNYRHNSDFDINGIINGQGREPVSKMKYGTKYMEQAGCGIIATYNALILLDNPHELQDLILWGDLNASLLFAQFGTNPYAIGMLFAQMGYNVYHVFDVAKYDAEVKKADLCIFTFWNDKDDIFEGAHTVCVQYSSGVINVYNEYNYIQTKTTKPSMKEWIDGNNLGPIDLCCISK